MSSALHLTVQDAFNAFHEELGFLWIAGKNGGGRRLTRDTDSGRRPRLLGPLNFNSPNRIQLLGSAEVRQFSHERDLDPARFEYALANTTELLIVSDALAAPAPLMRFAESHDIPVFVSALPFSELLRDLRHVLTRKLADRQIIHGVMMDVLGTGILITGSASVGKSELALELISRGHILVADDAPEFTRIAPGTLECRCPDLLKDFLEVRGLGVLNIARMYGDAHTRLRKILRFIVHLEPVHDEEDELDDTLAHVVGDRIGEPAAYRSILDVPIPQRTIPVAPGRNLAVLVEAAVRDEILRAGGYSASRDLVEKQAAALALGNHK